MRIIFSSSFLVQTLLVSNFPTNVPQTMLPWKILVLCVLSIKLSTSFLDNQCILGMSQTAERFFIFLIKSCPVWLTTKQTKNLFEKLLLFYFSLFTCSDHLIRGFCIRFLGPECKSDTIFSLNSGRRHVIFQRVSKMVLINDVEAFLVDTADLLLTVEEAEILHGGLFSNQLLV